MLISCKCLNFIATTSNNQQKQQQQLQNVSQQQLPVATTAADVATADLKKNNAAAVAAVAMQQSSNDCNNTLLAATSSNNNSIPKPSNDDVMNNESFSLTNVLRQTFLQKYPRNFVFYSQCMDFFKQAIGPVPDLTINVLSQRDLIYSLTLEITEAQSKSLWQLSVCSNCNVALCAKRLHNSPPQYLINCGLLTNNEELSQKRSDKAFSDTFGILIMDHPKMDVVSANNQNTNSNLTIGSMSTSFATSSSTNLHLDSKQLRLRQLQGNLQQRLQREIAETDERIQRYTAQQFALLKSFREKSEQEYQMLVTLIQCIPEQQANEWLERQPPALDVSHNGGNLAYAGARRRNTISSRRELSTAPTTPTAIQPPNTIYNLNRENYVRNSMTATPTSPTSAIITAANNTHSTTGVTSTASIATSTTPTTVGSVSSSALNRKMSNFDTPPATPEAIPMSVGNSPTFRQQQHNVFASQQQTVQQQYSTPSVETADDCLFELEGVDGSNIVSPQHQQQQQQQQQQNRTMYLQYPPSPMRLLQSQQQQPQNVPHQILPPYNSYQRSLSYINAQPENHMSDLDESDDAEEAEDALDLDTSMPIAMTATPHRRINSKTAAQVANFAKSLPIEIANSPLAVGRSYMATLESDEDELDNNVDIAASIKALAKSVHGEAVFGDLPRPRLRSQI
ncbi:uncharacterized protein PRAS40 [Calliphora vicina]|uniref:uncharacterized protein PRAS40 n=1 Tax=Calliphora vicina TaxID=7373 RepID=UPI00325AA6D9